MKVWWIDTASANIDERLERNDLETFPQVAQWVLTDRGLDSWPADWRLIDDAAGIAYDAAQINAELSP